MPCLSTPSQIKSISPLATPNQSHSPIPDRLEWTRVKYLTLGQHRMQQPHLCHFEIQLARHSRYRWVPRFAESYSQFLVALVSTLPKYLHEVTNKLIQEFDSPNTTHHHEILTKIIKYVPTSINSIPQLLQKTSPPHFVLHKGTYQLRAEPSPRLGLHPRVTIQYMATNHRVEYKTRR